MTKNKGTLYLVPTPIGNLDDITLRALEVLKTVDYIACEDTRNTQKLLGLLNIKNKTFSCHEHNERTATSKIIEDLNNGLSVAYASDAGFPCISDPGLILVQEAIKEDVKVVPLQGANAALSALIASGLDTKNFLFVGFLDPKISKKEAGLAGFLYEKTTLIFYEAPHRINETLASMYKVFGNRKVCIAREITKLHEEFIRSNLEDLVKENKEYKGELVIVLEGYKEKGQDELDQEIISNINKLVALNYSNKDIANIISSLFNVNKNKVKELLMKKD